MSKRLQSTCAACLLLLLLALPALAQAGTVYRFFVGGWLAKYSQPYRSFSVYAYGVENRERSGLYAYTYWQVGYEPPK